MDGERSTRSLAVILAGIRSAKEARRVEVKRGAEVKAFAFDKYFFFQHPSAGSTLSTEGAARDHGALPRRQLGRRHRAPARRRHVRASSASALLVVNRPGAGGAIGYKYVRLAESRRLRAGLEFELDLDQLPLRPARIRLQDVRRRGARAFRVGGGSRCAQTRKRGT